MDAAKRFIFCTGPEPPHSGSGGEAHWRRWTEGAGGGGEVDPVVELRLEVFHEALRRDVSCDVDVALVVGMCGRGEVVELLIAQRIARRRRR